MFSSYLCLWKSPSFHLFEWGCLQAGVTITLLIFWTQLILHCLSTLMLALPQSPATCSCCRKTCQCIRTTWLVRLTGLLKRLADKNIICWFCKPQGHSTSERKLTLPLANLAPLCLPKKLSCLGLQLSFITASSQRTALPWHSHASRSRPHWKL